jgi:tRNA A37 threonylcarbamoyladenosine dehydratase
MDIGLFGQWALSLVIGGIGGVGGIAIATMTEAGRKAVSYLSKSVWNLSGTNSNRKSKG